jgi:hypothetical protein
VMFRLARVRGRSRDEGHGSGYQHAHPCSESLSHEIASPHPGADQQLTAPPAGSFLHHNSISQNNIMAVADGIDRYHRKGPLDVVLEEQGDRIFGLLAK